MENVSKREFEQEQEEDEKFYWNFFNTGEKEVM